FIEPYPDLLLSLIKSKNDIKNKLISKKLQEVSVKIFKSLKENDILFIDSTHISKFNSDVNYIFFKILPTLNKGVIIHFHDIFHPFEYPFSWLKQGIFWNEIYLLRAFLQFNTTFKIIYFNNYLYQNYKKILLEELPLYEKNPGGSLYIKKIK
ncbi:MAG: class I SAM-dependent methyltransferase, partial [Candidatus Sericytochromatia bacterium]